MNCPSCGAPMRVSGDTFVCNFCKTVSVPAQDDQGVTVLGDGPGDLCPICLHLPLVNASVAKTPLLYCKQCHGLLIAMPLFSPLVDALRAQQRGTVPAPRVDPGELSRTLPCPHCHRSMEAHFYAGPGNVVIDTCETCEFNWLDHGELQRIASAPEYMTEVMDDGTTDSSGDPDPGDASYYPAGSRSLFTSSFNASAAKDSDNDALDTFAHDSRYSPAPGATGAELNDSDYDNAGSTYADATPVEQELRRMNERAIQTRGFVKAVQTQVDNFEPGNYSASKSLFDIVTDI